MSTEERPAVGQRMPAHRGTRSHNRDLPRKEGLIPDAPSTETVSDVLPDSMVETEVKTEPEAAEIPVLVDFDHKTAPDAAEVVENPPQEMEEEVEIEMISTEKPERKKPAEKAPGFLAGLKAKTKYAFSLKTDEDLQRSEAVDRERSRQQSSGKKQVLFGKRFKRFIKKKKLLSAILATIILILLVVIIAAAIPTHKQEEPADTSDYMDRIRTQEIRVNDVAAIDSFFSAYYTAMSSGNTTALESMYDDPSTVNITTEISTIVNQYDNFKVYITRGIDENEYIAFVYNDIHFANIEATAPSVDSFYLRYDPEAAALKICSDMYTNPDKLKYMNLISYRDPIRKLLSDTNEELSEALAGNTDLNNLYIIMQSMADTTTEE